MLLTLREWRTRLAEFKDPAQLKEMADKIRAVKAWAEIASATLETRNDIGETECEVRIRGVEVVKAERKAGRMVPASGGNPDKMSGLATLESHGIPPREFSRWMEEAKIPLRDRQEYYRAAREKQRQITPAGLRALAKEKEELPTPPCPKKKFRAIVVDPPWQMKKIAGKSPKIDQGGSDSGFLGYPQMTIEEIVEKTPVRKVMDKHCRVYLWTTQKYLCSGEAFAVLNGWGLKPICVMVWHKPGGMMPFGVNEWTYNAEFVIFARKGHPPISRKGQKLCFNAKRRQHSRKPDEFYEMVKAVGPGPRLDMFSREKRDGFDQWGNQKGAFNAE
jgi:N6-adenosine-specific RNA methylase IME4